MRPDRGLNRRHFLRAAGVGVALPVFESARVLAAGPAETTLAATATGAPLRSAFVYFPNGAIPAAWWPTGEGADFKLSRTLQPLEKVRPFVQVFGGLDHENYIRHGLLGHELLAGEGFPEPLCRFCSHHTGVGVTKDDVLRQGLPIPPADYLAVTREERLVMYADKFHGKSRPSAFLFPDEYAAHVRRFGEDKVTAFEALRTEFGDPDLDRPVPYGGAPARP